MGKRKLASDEGIVDSTSLSKRGVSPDLTCIGVSGPSSHQAPEAHAQTSLPSSKRPRIKDPQGSNATSPEKRGAIFKKSCPKNILDRVARVMSQR
jgi:hypothetical protein